MVPLNSYDELYSYEFLFVDVFERINIDDRSTLMRVSKSFHRFFLGIDQVKIIQLRKTLDIISEFFTTKGFLDRSNFVSVIKKDIRFGTSLIDIDEVCISIMSNISWTFISLKVTERKQLFDILPNNYIRTIYSSSVRMQHLDKNSIIDYFDGVNSSMVGCHEFTQGIIDVISKILSDEIVDYYETLDIFDELMLKYGVMGIFTIEGDKNLKIYQMTNSWIRIGPKIHGIINPQNSSDKYGFDNRDPEYSAETGLMGLALKQSNKNICDFRHKSAMTIILKIAVGRGEFVWIDKLIKYYGAGIINIYLRNFNYEDMTSEYEIEFLDRYRQNWMEIFGTEYSEKVESLQRLIKRFCDRGYPELALMIICRCMKIYPHTFENSHLFGLIAASFAKRGDFEQIANILNDILTLENAKVFVRNMVSRCSNDKNIKSF